MTDRDVAPFNRRAAGYERSLLQPLFFRPIQERTLRVAARVCPAPARILDVGCGTGSLLRLAHERFPEARLVGTDAAAEMIRHAHADGAAFVHAPAERLPFAAASFDLVTSTMSFHHWKDQQQGLNEAARVLAPGGVFVLADQLATPWLRPVFSLMRRRDRLHTPAEIETMLAAAGLAPLARRRVYDLDPLLLARTLRGRPALGTASFVVAILARKPRA